MSIAGCRHCQAGRLRFSARRVGHCCFRLRHWIGWQAPITGVTLQRWHRRNPELPRGPLGGLERCYLSPIWPWWKPLNEIVWGWMLAYPASAFCTFAYFFLNRSMRPAVSTSFCFPVKKGWHFEQVSVRISGLVEPTSMTFPQAQVMVVSTYSGWIAGFIGSFSSIGYLRDATER